MKTLLAVQLEGSETLDDILDQHAENGIHLMIHRDIGNGLHTFEERPVENVTLQTRKLTQAERDMWDAAASSINSRKPAYIMRGSAKPNVDIFPFPPHIQFTAGRVVVDMKIVWSRDADDPGDIIQLLYKGQLMASTGVTMSRWHLRKEKMKMAESVLMVRALHAVMRWLDEKLYDEED